MSNRCEDYPCCGHTDGLGCNYTPDYAFLEAHAGCDHENLMCVHDEFGRSSECDVCERDANYTDDEFGGECPDCGFTTPNLERRRDDYMGRNI